MCHLLLGEHRGCEFYPFSSITDSSPKEKGAQVLLHRPRTNVQLRRDFLVAASFHQQLQHLAVARRNLDLGQDQHEVSSVDRRSLSLCSELCFCGDRKY
jgi:hypothetical protein